MAESNFWSRIAKEFEELGSEFTKYHACFHAYWNASGWNGTDQRWVFDGACPDRIYQKFVWVSELAAQRLAGHPDKSIWLDHLKSESPNFEHLDQRNRTYFYDEPTFSVRF